MRDKERERERESKNEREGGRERKRERESALSGLLLSFPNVKSNNLCFFMRETCAAPSACKMG